ncbi:uncharacterized protein LOC122060890 [Macadamia integrifolia]|uniref:uncharacterized protein LOC122060890 n=1 Tax=Macadamia integrifolia TaxID=60698 RepID=UPI001C52B339|nr:uncharacterized protein LOC122060890 [Macadamia integrifolia]XP_042479932.1 uncharacterized protein LOC122060890 [Macadamia integrifolia]
MITLHVLAHHKDEIEKRVDGNERKEEKSNICQECSSSFKKPAYLRQNMQGHSLEDESYFWLPFSFSVADSLARTALSSLVGQVGLLPLLGFLNYVKSDFEHFACFNKYFLLFSSLLKGCRIILLNNGTEWMIRKAKESHESNKQCTKKIQLEKNTISSFFLTKIHTLV